jgi:hypothetical protein
MRRLLFLLLAIIGTLGLAPAAPARVHVIPMAHTAMPGGCHDGGQAATHACVGCAVAPERLEVVQVAATTMMAPLDQAPSKLAGRRTGFDPPPPRLRA